MEALRDLADDFNVRDPRKLYRLARQRDLDATQAMAFEALKADVGRQVQAPRPRALGKAAEGPNDRLQADLIDFSQNTRGKTKYGLVVMDVFTREAAVEPLQNKNAETVGRATKRAAKELTGDDGNFVVTTDLGNEFPTLDRELLAEAVHRTKRCEDRNAIAVVDLRSVSFQLPCEEDVLPSAFEDKPLCVPRQLAELLQLSAEEVCADFDAMLRHDWRRLGISAEEVREFCVWRNAPMRVLSSQGDLVDSYDPTLKEHRTVCLAFDGHCYMYRAVKRVLERQAARVLYRGEARQTLPPIQEWRRFDAADVQPGLFWCEDLREARRQLMAAGESPKVAISSPAQYCGLRLRRGARIQELPEEHEVLRRWCEALNQEYRGQRLAGLAHEIFLKLAGSARRGGEAEDPGRAGRQVRAVRLRADGRRAGPRGAGKAGLCGQRADFAGAVRRLPQREDADGERARAAWPPASWSTPGAPSCPLWFLRRRRATTRCTSAWTWCAAGATGWPTPPSCPSCARRTALSPWTACCRTWALWRVAATRGSPA